MARDAARRVVVVHQRVAEFLRIGVTLAQIDNFIAKQLEDLKSKSSFLGYRQGPATPVFPGHACLSVNDCVVHGTVASHPEPLRPGDVLKIDVGVNYRGFMGDAAWTYAFGERSDVVERLMDCGRETMRIGPLALRPGATYLAWAQAVQPVVERDFGFHLVEGLGGHGLGRTPHSRPFISNIVPENLSSWADAKIPCLPGHYVAVETMIAAGTPHYVEKPLTKRTHDWPVRTADASMSVHYEHDVLITESGPEIITKELDQQPDVVG